MTWNTVSIEPGSEMALALAAEDLAVMHYTGRSITKGYGRDKTSTYRSGIQTKLGDIEQSQWQALMRDIIRRNGELKLLDALIAWELEHTPWVHTREEAEQRALESFTSRSFDNPKWSDYEAFNRKHRPEVLTNQSTQERKDST